jgi:NAD(P)-dependent dehydrogenase (short-subunit alcohol dehydrogenase family)
MRLQGKVAVVTGAGSGIGQSVSFRFAEEGADVVCADIIKASAQETAAAVQHRGGKAAVVAVDVSKKDQVEAMVARALAEFGRLDIMVANAGISLNEPLLEMREETWDQVLGVNLKGVFLCCQAAAREMVKAGRGGKIVATASMSGEVAHPTGAAYCTSKAGVRMLTKVMAQELAPHRVNVNCVGPGVIDTPMSRAAMPDEAMRQQMLMTIPWGSFGQPSDIANTVLFLASGEADYVTGVTVFVDGGRVTQ